MASLLTGVCPQCLYAHRRATAPYVTKCYSFGILAPWAVDCKCRKEFLQFSTFNTVTVNSEKFKQRIAELQVRFKVTDAKTQELLEDLREQIKIVESITFED